MQDRFRYRVWNKAANKFEEKCIVYNDGRLCIVHNNGRAYVNGNPNYVLVQCTGLKDKNGKLIYEGGIVKDKRSGSIAIIEYDSYAYSLMAHIRGMDDYFPLKDLCYLGQANTPFEVIGNIYENPELLEG